MAALTEIPSNILSGALYKILGIKTVFCVCFCISVIGSTLLIIFNNNTSVIPVFILLARFGVSATFNVCYLANGLIFPTIFAGTAFGICNMFAKLATIVSPELAEIEAPVPMIVFDIICALAAGLSLIL